MLAVPMASEASQIKILKREYNPKALHVPRNNSYSRPKCHKLEPRTLPTETKPKTPKPLPFTSLLELFVAWRQDWYENQGFQGS